MPKSIEPDTQNIEYWKSVNPQSSITDNPFERVENLTPYAVNENFNILKERLSVEGYFFTNPIVSPDDIEKLIQIITNIVKKTPFRSTYALLYDDFYHVAAKLSNLLNPILGEGYLLVADEIEAYYIANSDNAGGSPHHRDSLMTHNAISADGMPLLVNIWVALTDVTPEDSCMYVVPAQHDPDYPKNGIQPDSPNRMRFHPEDIRAVPVKAGSVIGWSTSLIHWGGRNCSFAKHPRMSFAMYFQSGDVPPFHYANFTFNQKIPFPLRMHLVEKAYSEKTQQELEVQFKSCINAIND